MDEEVKYIPGTKNFFAGSYGKIYQRINGVLEECSEQENSEGYLRVYYYKHNDPKRKRGFVHRLIYETFHGEIPKDMDVDHKDWDRKNNSLKNLQLLPKEKNRKRTTLNRRNTMPNLELECVETGEKFLIQGIKYAAEHIGVSATTVSRVLRGRQQTAGGFLIREV